MTTENLSIWDAVSKTDPKHTKHVNQRGGFTAISANYQIMSATKQFGPIGIGWGYIAAEPIFQQSLIIIPVTLWHGDRSNTFGPAYGCAEIFGKRADADAPKKATTDAITKLLSQLGFNADVFLGKFDDNKYVAELNAEQNAPPQKISADQFQTISAKIEAAGITPEKIAAAYKVEQLHDLTVPSYESAMKRLDATIAGKAA